MEIVVEILSLLDLWDTTGFCTSEPETLVVAAEIGRPQCSLEHGQNNTSGQWTVLA